MNERKTPQAQENMDQANKDVNSAAKNLMNAAGELFSSIGDNFAAQRELNAAKMQDAAASAKETLDNAGKFVSDKVTSTWNGITSMADNIADNARKQATMAAGVALGGAAMAANAVKETGEKAADALHGTWNNGWAFVENVAEKAQGKTETELVSTKDSSVDTIRKKMLDNGLLKKGDGLLDKGSGLVSKISGETEHDAPKTAEKSTENESKNTEKEPAKTETQTEPVMIQFDQDMPELTPAAKKQNRVEKAAAEKAEAERLDALYKDTLAGKYGNGEERKKALGDDYDVIQGRINEHYTQKANTELITDIETPSTEASVELQ